MSQSAYIGAVFVLSGMLVLLVQIAAHDGWLAWKTIQKEFGEVMDHDTKVFPDQF